MGKRKTVKEWQETVAEQTRATERYRIALYDVLFGAPSQERTGTPVKVVVRAALREVRK